MKPIFTYFIGLAMALSSFGQDTLYIYESGGQISILAITEVDSIIFYRPEDSQAVDIDGNIYETIVIGTQTWMTANLRVTKYRNGNVIGTTSPATLDISVESAPKYQWAYDGNSSTVADYGRLYTWYAITDVRGICPVGWHIPSDEEWQTLVDYLGSNSEAGDKLKEAGNMHWTSDNAGTNQSGFTATGSGSRLAEGTFEGWKESARFWNASACNSASAYTNNLQTHLPNVDHFCDSKSLGLSVRCIKD